MFIKYLFPEQLRGAQKIEDQRGASESSESGDESINNGSIGAGPSPVRPNQLARRPSHENISYTGSSLLSGSLKSQKVAEQVKQLDITLKLKLATDFNSVRKAFLAIDDSHRGFISAETLAKYLGASKQKNFDFTLLEILIKLNTKGLKTRINYNDFVSWLGNSIEPTDTFVFRHDSKKNPQFEVNLQKTVQKIEPSQ